ncbi:MAG: fatty-acyl-CoA synthase [Thermoleophilaceae bacterium]|nr:fatty-acyl-CoA synthase [Thermoleophilaceae bacterium]
MPRSYAHGASDTPLLGETIGESLERTVARFPEREALVVRQQGIRLTYRELNERVDRLARALMAAGLETGDRLGIWAPNCAEWVLVQFASAKAGVILVNVNPAYRTSELEYALDQSGCRVLVAAREFKDSDYVAMVEEVRPQLERLERVVHLDSPDWDELLAESERVGEDALRERSAGLDTDDPINIQYTSGTTGFPKGATLSHHNILNNGYFVAEGCRYTEDDRVCIPVPFYHCFGMVMGNLGAVTHGAAMVVPAPAFEPGAVLETVQAERCTSLYGVPTMFIAELAHPDFASFDLSSLRTGIMAGSPCPVEVMKRVIDEMNMADVTICYGMTETSPVSTQTGADDTLEKRVGSVGRVHPHVEVKIVDPASGHTLPRGERGELLTRGYSVMRGYWNDPERTADAIDSARWMHTGDLATMDEDAYVNIVGRSKEMVIRGGENIYPREIEEFLIGLPEVEDVAVFGVPDRKYGEELVACVRLASGASLDEDGVRSFCRGRIAHFKVPRYVRFVDEFPMTVTGKVQKFKMRDAAVDELGLAEEVGATA